MTSAHPLLSTLASAALVAGLAACSSQPAVCDDMDALRSSLADLRDLSVSKDGVDAVRAQLADVGDQVDQLKADASSEYQPQIDVVKGSETDLRTSLSAAKEGPTAQTLAQVADDLGALTSAVEDLGTAVSTTCE